MPATKRFIGHTDIEITSVAMGCWPIAGMTSINVNDDDSIATLRAAFDSGINFFDTAYCYGASGESERLIQTALGRQRDQIVIATKCGIAWDSQGQRVFAGQPQQMRSHFEESLSRLGTDHVELLYLHGPDPEVPIEESAGQLKRFLDEGKARSIGASNCNCEQLERFASECPISAVQPHYNMLQREIEQDVLPWCQQHGGSAITYWPLMKGLLAGKLARDHQFDPKDGRAKYPMFQGTEWEKNQDFVDALREIAAAAGYSVAQLVVAWTIQQPGITSALCGAKRAYQIEETAKAMNWQFTESEAQQIAQAIAQRGTPVSQSAV